MKAEQSRMLDMTSSLNSAENDLESILRKLEDGDPLSYGLGRVEHLSILRKW